MNKLVSVIMPLYNSEIYMRNSINSVIAQKYLNWELILINDGSSDNTFLIASNYLKIDNRIKLINLKFNKGVAYARNVGLDNAVGHFIAFLDSDDLWLEDKLLLQVHFMNNVNVDISYCIYNRVSEAGTLISTFKPKDKLIINDLYKSNQIAMLTAMYNKSKFSTIRFRNVKHEDYVFWFDLFSNGANAELVPSTSNLAIYVVRSNSVSGNKFYSAIWHWFNLRKDFNLSFLRSLYYFFNYLLINISKYIK